MTNQPPNNDSKPEDSGEGQQPGYTPPTYGAPASDPNQVPGAPSGNNPPAGGGYAPPSYGTPGQGYSAPSGNNPPAGGGYAPPDYGAPGQGYSAPSGNNPPAGGGYAPPSYGAPGQGYSAPSGNNPPAGGGYAPPSYGAPSTPDQSFGQTPSYGASTPDPYGQQPGQAPYGQQPGGYDPNAGQAPYGQQPGGYGAPTPYGAPGGYQPNPYGQTGPQLAAWPRRAVGALIDFVAPSLVLSLIFRIVMPDGGFGASLLELVLLLGWWAYNSGYRVATTGYSFGHKLGKVRVVMEDTGQTPVMNTAITRALSHFLDSICLIGFLFPLWDAKKQTFADKIAKTVVIDEQQQQR